MVDLTPILQAVIALIASIITLKVIPWIKDRTMAQQQVLLRTTTEILVRAAEQLYGSGKGQGKLNHLETGLDPGSDSETHLTTRACQAEIWQFTKGSVLNP